MEVASLGFQKSEVDVQLLCYLAKHSCHAAYHLLLWTARDVYRNNDTNGPFDQASAVTTVCNMREKLVDVLKFWLEFPIERTEIDGISDQIHHLRLEAFRMIGDLRILFSATQRNVSVTSLFWAPSQDLLQSMRAMFEAESAHIQQLLETFGDSPSDLVRSKALSVQFLDGLLLPLGQIAICDMTNLNRRQAAVVLNYLVDSNEHVIEFVKLWAKMLKDADPIKYLEIQMVAIKAMYCEKVMKLLSILKSANVVSSQNRHSLEEIEMVEEMLETNCGLLSTFAQRVGQTMGIGKLKGAIADALVNFFRAGIDFALSESVAVSFFSVLNSYCRFLAPPLVTEVREYLQSKLDSPLVDPDVYSLIHDDISAAQPKLWSTRCYKAYYSFFAALTGKKIGHNPNTSQMDVTFNTATASAVSGRVQRRKIPRSEKRSPELDQEQPARKFSDFERTVADTSDLKRRYNDVAASTDAPRLSGHNELSTRDFEDEEMHRAVKHVSGRSSRTTARSEEKYVRHLRGRLSTSTDEVTDESDEEEFLISKRRRSDIPKRAVNGKASDAIVYGLHIEDINDEMEMPIETFSRNSGKISIESSIKYGSEPRSAPLKAQTLFSESSQEEDKFEEIISRKSSRNRNR